MKIGKDRTHSEQIKRLEPVAGGNPFDLMLRSDNDLFVPVIFFNKSIPGILSCVSRELQRLRNEQCLMHKLSGQTAPFPLPGPLADWYESVFQGTSPDVPFNRWLNEPPGPESSGFSLPAAAAEVIPMSSYRYVILSLPPLWNRENPDRSGTGNTGITSPGRMIAAERMVCHFRYQEDHDIWYACLDKPVYKKRLFRRLASAKESYGILQEARV